MKEMELQRDQWVLELATLHEYVKSEVLLSQAGNLPPSDREACASPCNDYA